MLYIKCCICYTCHCHVSWLVQARSAVDRAIADYYKEALQTKGMELLAGDFNMNNVYETYIWAQGYVQLADMFDYRQAFTHYSRKGVPHFVQDRYNEVGAAAHTTQAHTDYVQTLP